MTATEPLCRIEVVQSLAPRQTQSMVLNMPAGSTVQEALQLTAWPLPDSGGIGIWGRKTTLAHVLRDGDRLEIYRALVVDPKEARRLRYAGSASKRRISGNKRYQVVSGVDDITGN
jgi:uncharacterized protein